MADFAVQAQRLDDAQGRGASARSPDLRRPKRRLGAEKAEIDDKAAEAKELLHTLEERAAARASRAAARSAASAAAPTAPAGPTGSTGPSAAPSVPAAAPASGRAAAAVATRWPRSASPTSTAPPGPSAFDCSGLTMMAWAQAGVGLPHSSSAQMGSGTPVSQSELQPGDLVFYYSPVSHVGMYIGNGQIVNALNPGAGVQVSPVSTTCRTPVPSVPADPSPPAGRPRLVGGRPRALGPPAGRRGDRRPGPASPARGRAGPGRTAAPRPGMPATGRGARPRSWSG